MLEIQSFLEYSMDVNRMREVFCLYHVWTTVMLQNATTEGWTGFSVFLNPLFYAGNLVWFLRWPGFWDCFLGSWFPYAQASPLLLWCVILYIQTCRSLGCCQLQSYPFWFPLLRFCFPICRCCSPWFLWMLSFAPMCLRVFCWPSRQLVGCFVRCVSFATSFDCRSFGFVGWRLRTGRGRLLCAVASPAELQQDWFVSLNIALFRLSWRNWYHSERV